MKKHTIVIDYISYGDDMMERRYPKPDNWNEIAENIFISGYDRETFECLQFYISRKHFSQLDNKSLVTRGSVISLAAIKTDNVLYGVNYLLLDILPRNYHDLNIQLSDFPEILSGEDSIKESYTLKGQLIGGAEAGKEVNVRLSKDSFYNFALPNRKWSSCNPLNVLREEDAKIFLEEGDIVTFKSCLQINDDTYESMGWLQSMKFDAEVTLLSTKWFHKDHRFKKGHGELSVMFNKSHLIGRLCTIVFSAEENPHFPVHSKLIIKGAYKNGVSKTPNIVARSVRLA
jgi:hypothetical protein